MSWFFPPRKSIEGPPAKISRPGPNGGDAFLVGIMPDDSYSMHQDGGIEHMVSGFSKLQVALGNCTKIASQIEFGLVSFGTEVSVKTMLPFTKLANCRFPTLPKAPSTHLYEGYAHLVALTIARKEQLRIEEDRDVAGAFVIVMSDFQALQHDANNYRAAALDAKKAATENGINVFNLMCGQAVREDIASELSQDRRPPIPMDVADLDEAFAQWLAKSVRMAGASMGRTTPMGSFNGTDLYLN